MRRVLFLALLSSVVCGVAYGQQGVIHGSGDPRLRSPQDSCPAPFYQDDATGIRYETLSEKPCVWGQAGGASAAWHRIGIVNNSLYGAIYSDPGPQVQETTTLVSTSPELLTYLSKVRLYNFDVGWWPNQKICFGEAPDDYSQPVRFPHCIAGEARASLIWDPVNSEYALLAENESTSKLDVFENATINGLSQMTSGAPTYSAVLACGGNGTETINSFGGADAVWDATKSLWRVFYGCQNSQAGSGNGWQSWLATGPNLGTLTKYQAAPVCGYGTTASNANIVECGVNAVYVGTKLYGYASTGPTGIMPTPYFYRVVDATGIGNAFVADPNPTVSWQGWMEGLNYTQGQIAGMTFGPSLSGTGTVMYYGVLNGQGAGTLGCIAGVENPAPLNTVLQEVTADQPEPIGVCTNYGLYDSFVGPSAQILQLHSSDTQHAWQQGWAGAWPATAQLNGSGYVVVTGTNATTGYFSSFRPQTPDYTVQATCNVGTTGGSGCVLLGRLTVGPTQTGYEATFFQGSGVTLARYTTGGATQIGSTYAGVTTGSHVIALTMSGPNFKVYVDGTLQISQTDTTYINAGAAGFGMYQAGSGSTITLTAFEAY
jgi:hypothetical protein